MRFMQHSSGWAQKILLFILCLSFLPSSSAARAQTPIPQEVQRLLASMTSEERVGQLFLVTFNGVDVAEQSNLYNLITRYHVGGVALLKENDNFAFETDLLPKAQALIQSIQQIEWETSQRLQADAFIGPQSKRAYIPLFIMTARQGNDLLSGLTPLPSQMAIGATWNIELASKMGEVRGRELAALGFNLYLGPSLDVLEAPSVVGGDLGVRVFGGDPFWVGEMGRAYIAGLHKGSAGKMFVAARHFPGVGGSDRLPEEEVSTVRKSIEQLKQIELAPFFAVTGGAPAVEARTDGLLVSHIRYQGFQGNIRATTRPIGLDSQALAQILALPQFSAWHSEGGLLISDDLSTRAVREFYTSGGGQFSARNAARDAFLAGNDMLYLGNITTGDNQDVYTTTTIVIDFFNQKYREDPAFAQRVDAAALRILTAKYRMYGSFNFSAIMPSAQLLEGIGASSDLTFDVARSAATLISPDPQDLAEVMPLPPQENDRLVFITDALTERQCSTCAEQSTLSVDALQQTVTRLYGLQSGSQSANFRMSSYSFQTLQALLDDKSPELIERDLYTADWVIFSLRDASQGQPALVTRFLRERPELLRDKRLIVFSFGEPYYFDTTTISKFTAYFALYSSQPQFVDVAARLLFQELTPRGASPVSVSAVGYEMISVMSPDPLQVISLSLDLPPAPFTTDTPLTPEPTPIPLFKIGDTIAIRAGVILDHNGNPVPDGTVVQFSMLLTGEGGGILKQVDSVTTQGVARAAFGLDKPGLLEIKAVSEPALISEVLQLDVSSSGAVAVTVVAPELTQPSAEPTPQPPVIIREDPYVSPQGYPLFSAWFFAMLLIGASVWVVYVIARQIKDTRSLFRWVLGIGLGGLTAYNLLVLGLPGINNWLLARGLSGALAFVFFGELIGFIAGLLWSWKKR